MLDKPSRRNKAQERCSCTVDTFRFAERSIKLVRSKEWCTSPSTAIIRSFGLYKCSFYSSHSLYRSYFPARTSAKLTAAMSARARNLRYTARAYTHDEQRQQRQQQRYRPMALTSAQRRSKLRCSRERCPGTAQKGGDRGQLGFRDGGPFECIAGRTARASRQLSS